MSIDIVPFQDEYIDAAGALLAGRQQRDRLHLPDLPARFEDAAAASAAVAETWQQAGVTGVAALHAGRLIGYLLGRPVIDDMWGRSAWIRLTACALAPDEDAELVRTLYAALAAPWVQQGIFFHFALLPVADPGLIHAWFSLSFGIEQVYGLADLAQHQPAGRPLLATPGFPAYSLPAGASGRPTHRLGQPQPDGHIPMSSYAWLRRFSRRIWLRTRWGSLTGRSLIDLVLIVVGAGLTAVSVVVFLNPNDVVRRRETRIVQEIVRQADPDAFVVISPSACAARCAG